MEIVAIFCKNVKHHILVDIKCICILKKNILNRFSLISLVFSKDPFGQKKKKNAFQEKPVRRDVALIINRSILPLSSMSVVVFLLLLASTRKGSNRNNAEI